MGRGMKQSFVYTVLHLEEHVQEGVDELRGQRKRAVQLESIKATANALH